MIASIYTKITITSLVYIQITKRGGKVIAHVQLLYQQMVKEESKLKDSLQAKIEKQKQLITQLNVELSLPEYKYPNNLPLLQTDELLGYAYAYSLIIISLFDESVCLKNKINEKNVLNKIILLCNSMGLWVELFDMLK